MVKLVNAVMLEREGRLVRLVLGILCFAVLGLLLVILAHRQLGVRLQVANREAIERRIALNAKVDEALDTLRTRLPAEPCSLEFRAAMHRFAYLPDGLNEFIYAPDGRLECSAGTERFEPAIALGAPDVERGDAGGSAIWFDRDLGAIGLGGMIGTIVLRDSLAVVVPPDRPGERVDVPDWIRLEVMRRDSHGNWWHRSGERGLYEAARAPDAAVRFGFGEFFRVTACDAGGSYCAASVADPWRLASTHRWSMLLGFAGLVGLSALFAHVLRARVKRYCSFENRFRRHLDSDSIICSYQPVLDLASGRVTGCEVLARWRDVDGSVVFPDRFIPLVEREGLTLAFTRAIVEKAMRELSATLPASARLHVAFNVFPIDLGDARLPEVFHCCRSERGRFSIVAEIVESAAFVASEARAQIEALRREEVGVYLDDFGSGYSNIQTLAALPIEGVKLDRAFAMAADDSVMARMLAHAVDLVSVAGRVVVVEGVETAARLATLRALGSAVDRVQGYHVSRPLPIAEFAAFLAADRGSENMAEAA